MTTTREAALEAALQEIMSSDSYESRETFDGSNKHVVITKFGEFGQIAHDAISTPTTEPQGYVEGLDENGDLIGSAAEILLRGIWRQVAKFHNLPLDGVVEADLVRAILAARPAPQPTADTRVTDAMILEIWSLAQQYDDFDPAFRSKIRAIIGAATPAQSDKIAEAARGGVRKAVASAIFDPGATEGYRGERTVTEWQTDAVMRALAGKGE